VTPFVGCLINMFTSDDKVLILAQRADNRYTEMINEFRGRNCKINFLGTVKRTREACTQTCKNHD